MDVHEATREPAASSIFIFIIIISLSNCFVNF